MSLQDILWTLTTDYNSLPRMLKIAGIKAASTRKADMVAALEKYLKNEQNIIRTWNRLNPLEKELMEECVRSNGKLEYDEIKQVFQKHNVEFPYTSSYSCRFSDVFDDYSPARLFFINRYIPKSIYNVLKRMVKPLEIKYTPIKKAIDNNIDAELVIGESFIKDCINFMKLVNNSKLKTTKVSGLPNKTAFLKINEVLVNKEILTSDFDDLSNIRNIEQTFRIYGLSNLLREAKLIEEAEGRIVLGLRAKEFLKASCQDKCEMLLDAYINSEKIYELDRIRELKMRVSVTSNLRSGRELVLKYLSHCPVNEWIEMNEMLTFIKKNDREFLTDIVGEILTYDEYNHYYYSGYHNWRDIEGRFVEIVLLEYLSAMGIVDIGICEKEDCDYRYIQYYSVKYFRLTSLGAYVLGITDDYTGEAMQEDSGFLIQPNYEIVIAAGNMQDVHEFYLDSFAEKISAGSVSVYKLSFKSIIKALDRNISVKNIITYLEEYASQPIPENVLLTLQEWERESKRIKIRTVKILETDDLYLLEELKSYKTIRNNVVNELPYAIEIDSKATNKLKREIEKKHHFCIIEE